MLIVLNLQAFLRVFYDLTYLTKERSRDKPKRIWHRELKSKMCPLNNFILNLQFIYKTKIDFKVWANSSHHEGKSCESFGQVLQAVTVHVT